MISLQSPLNSTKHTQVIVTDQLGVAAREGEFGVAWARLVGSLTVTIMWLIVHGDYLWAPVPYAVATFDLGVLALGWSFYVFHRLRDSNPSAALTYASIVIDAILINSLVFGSSPESVGRQVAFGRV